MSYTSTSHAVFIEPYCIFCQEATSHVENRTFTKRSSSSWTVKETSYSKETRYTNTTTESFSSSFPAHPECLRTFEKGRRSGLLIGTAVPIVTFLILGVLHMSRILTFGCVPLIIGMIALAAGVACWSFANDAVKDALEQQVRFYYNRHVQADVPAFSSATREPTLVVSVPEDYKDIQTAIAKVSVGTRILVHPGKYTYSHLENEGENVGLIINKPVEIIGDGQVEDIVIKHGIRIQTPNVKIKGITIEDIPDTDTGQKSAVNVVFGKVLIEDCHILCSIKGGATIYIDGPMSEATIRRNNIIAKGYSGSSGIYVTQRGSCIAEDCDVSVEPKEYFKTIISSGVVTYKQGSLTLRRCKVHHMGDFGIALDNCRAVLEDCLISGNGHSGVIISSQVDLSIRNCKIFQNGDRGVLIGATDTHPSNVIMEECDVFDNEAACIEIWRGNNPTVRNCRIHEGKKDGIFIYDSSQGLIDECDIFGNDWAGVQISDSSNPTIRNCRIYDGKQGGIYIHDDAKGVIQNCKIYENTFNGISIYKGSSPVIQQCQINHNGDCGVKLQEMSTAIVEECNLTDNVKGAWQIASDCQVNQKGNIEVT